MIEETMSYLNQTGSYTTTWGLSMPISYTNLWIVPEFPSFLILPLFMMATLLAIIAFRRKRFKH
jgi:hypothetical protein